MCTYLPVDQKRQEHVNGITRLCKTDHITELITDHPQGNRKEGNKEKKEGNNRQHSEQKK